MHLFKKDLYPLLKLAIPLALTGILQSSVFFFETMFLAHLGNDILAAGALVTWLFGTLLVTLFGTLSSINILIAHKFGANDKQSILKIVRDGMWLAVLFAPPMFLLFWNMAPIFLLFGQSPAIVLLAKAYLHAIAWGVLPNVIMIALLEVIMGLGRARLILIIGVITVALTIFFSFALIFGEFGFPALGIAGAGWGMTISYWIATLILVTYVALDKSLRPYFSLVFTAAKPSYWLELLHVGTPMGIMYCVEVAFFFALTLIMGSFGVLVMAANQIVLQYMGALMQVIFSIAQAITVRIGHLLGAGDKNSAERTCYIGVFLCTLLMLILGLVYTLCPEALISIDIDVDAPGNTEIVHYAVQFLLICAVFQIVEAMRITLFGALRGLKDTRFTLSMSIISFWAIALPLGYILSSYLGCGPGGLWWGMVFGAGAGVGLLFWRFKSRIENYSTLEALL